MKRTEEDEKYVEHAQPTRIPSWLWNIMLRCTTDNLGEKGTHTLLRRAGLEDYIGITPSYDDTPAITSLEYARFKEALFDIFGEEGARPILLRCGRLGYQCVLDNFPPSIKIAQRILIILPEWKKLVKAVTEFLHTYDKAMGTTSHVIESEGKVMVEIQNSTSQGLHFEKPVCYVESELILSVINTFVGPGFTVNETLCMGKGDPICQFEITKEKKNSIY